MIPGIAIVATSPKNIASRPGNLILAKANAARAAVRQPTIVEGTTIINVFLNPTNIFTYSLAWKTSI